MLLDIIQPEFIITLGKSVFGALAKDERFNAPNDLKFKYYNNVINAGLNEVCEYRYKINNEKTAVILPVAHTGGLGTRNRNSYEAKVFDKSEAEWTQKTKSKFPQKKDKLQVGRDWDLVSKIINKQ